MSGLSRAWDDFDAYLFDVDGTLLHCTDAVHYFAFCNALESIAGRRLTLEGVTVHGNTDAGILRDAFAAAGVAEDKWRPQMPAILDAMCRYVEDRGDQVCATTMPQVEDVLRHLDQRGATLGVATGNLERIGRIKLGRAGLRDCFHFCAWSDGFEYRNDVIANAILKARAIAGEHAAICVVGDTPADVTAAHRNGLPAIAVATGIHPFEELECAQPELCIHTFADLLSPA
jgi:phosphoglycolate phosphatase